MIVSLHRPWYYTYTSIEYYVDIEPQRPDITPSVALANIFCIIVIISSQIHLLASSASQ